MATSRNPWNFTADERAFIREAVARGFVLDGAGPDIALVENGRFVCSQLASGYSGAQTMTRLRATNRYIDESTARIIVLTAAEVLCPAQLARVLETVSDFSGTAVAPVTTTPAGGYTDDELRFLEALDSATTIRERLPSPVKRAALGATVCRSMREDGYSSADMIGFVPELEPSLTKTDAINLVGTAIWVICPDQKGR